MAADDADAPGYSDARGPGTIFRPACLQHVRADAGLQAVASEQILVSPLYAVAIAVPERQAFLHGQTAIFAGGRGRTRTRLDARHTGTPYAVLCSTDRQE